MKSNAKSFYKILTMTVLITILLSLFSSLATVDSTEVISRVGSRGNEVSAIQRTLKERGLYHDEITGYYGTITEAAVKRFQKQQGFTVDGVAGPAVLKALGISIGEIPDATEANIYLLARIISAEARGETYVGQVAVGACVLNRIEHPSFPDTLAGVIYQKGAFTAVTDGQFDEPIQDSAYGAARDALNGWDPSGGAIYYYNPKKTNDAFIHSRPIIKVIGDHRFCS